MTADGELAKLVANWSAPPELGGSPPRPVRLTGAGLALTVIALGMLAGGLILGVKLSNDFARRNQTASLLKEQGADTTATIIRLWRGSDKDRTRHVSYQYQIQGGVYHGSAQPPRSIWEGLTEGSTLRIRYLPSNPLVSRPVDWEPQQPPAWLPLFVPACFAVYTVIIFVMLKKQRSLLEDGRAAPGIVHRVARTKDGKRVRYDFLMPGGLREKGSGSARLERVEPGSVITIIYDPDQPRRNAPYPFALVRPAQ